MHDTPFEIRDDEIDVEEIMKKIRENIRRRKEAGLYPADPDPATAPQAPAGVNPEIARDLAYLTGNWDIQNNSYFISSHRPYVGKYLVKGRELVHGEVRRYVDPVIWKQAAFNRSAARVLGDAAGQLSGVEDRMGGLEDRVRELDSLPQQVREDTSKQIQGVIKEFRSRIERQLQEKESKLRDEFSDIPDQIRSDINELVSQMRADIAEEVEERLREKESRLRDEFSDIPDQIRSDINELVSQMKADIAEEVEERFRGKEALIMSELLDIRDQVWSGIHEIASEVKAEIATEIEEQVRSVVLAMNADIENRAWLAKVLEGRTLRGTIGAVKPPNSPSTETGLNYFVFEDHFRGSREDIRERQRAFVRYFEGCSNVLDIGCGRGEFLELMRDEGIGARGVDLDETMVEFCRSRGLEVELNDAVSYLEQIEDESLDGVFIDQVVEHLEPAYLVRLLELCYRKLKYGFYLIAETVNPLSFASLANFYIDMTHVRPVHPATLKFLFGAAGFREIEVDFLSPVSEGSRLQKLPVDEEMTDLDRQQTEISNRNIEMQNGILFGAQDYAITGKK